MGEISSKHIRIIAFYWNRYILRSGSGLTFLMTALLFGLISAQTLIMPVEQLIRKTQGTKDLDPKSIRYTIINIEKPIVQFILGIKSLQQIGQDLPEDLMNSMISKPVDEETSGFDTWTSFLLVKRPALLSAIFLVLLLGMPFVVSFLAFNQVSGDMNSHGLRYLLLKTERGNIYMGRFVGTVVFSTIVNAFLVGIIAFYIGMRINIYPFITMIVWSFYGFLVLSILMIPYIALCSMISVSTDSPSLSFLFAQLIIDGVLIIAAFGSRAWEPLRYIGYLLPWGWQNHLLHPSLMHLLAACLGCLAYSAVFLSAGYYWFEKRDL